MRNKSFFKLLNKSYAKANGQKEERLAFISLLFGVIFLIFASIIIGLFNNYALYKIFATIGILYLMSTIILCVWKLVSTKKIDINHYGTISIRKFGNSLYIYQKSYVKIEKNACAWKQFEKEVEDAIRHTILYCKKNGIDTISMVTHRHVIDILKKFDVYYEKSYIKDYDLRSVRKSLFKKCTECKKCNHKCGISHIKDKSKRKFYAITIFPNSINA